MPDTPSTPPAPNPIIRRGVGCVLPVVLAALFVSLLVNGLLGYLLSLDLSKALQPEPAAVREMFYLGDPAAEDRVAVVRIEGVISELTTAYPVRQMEVAAADPRVKAVVLRVNSPGGTVSASDELYQCLVNLRDGTGRRFPGGPKPLAVSLGPVAASGGYYVAAAGKPILAERTTITGSIGVFAALPNVAKLAADNGVRLELVKAGGIKASGSFFHDLSPDERQTWQDVVDNAYDTFLGVVAAGRPLTADRLRTEVVIDRVIDQKDAKGNPKPDAAGQPMTAKYTRTRADGGTFTAAQAVQFGLADGIGDLPAAVRAAAAAAGLTTFRAVTYDRPPGLIDFVLGGQLKANPGRLDLEHLADVLTPRLWYLSPAADAALLAPAR